MYCSFFKRTGACRNGDRCLKAHFKPALSKTVILQNFYMDPENFAKSADGSHLVSKMSDKELQEQFDDFFEDVFIECEEKYGEIEDMLVCDNIADHLIGNVYIKFFRENHAKLAVNDLNNRWFDGRPIFAILSPVTSFNKGCCAQYEMKKCQRNRYCNFLHPKPISQRLHNFLFDQSRRHQRSSQSCYHVGARRTKSLSRHGHHRNGDSGRSYGNGTRH